MKQKLEESIDRAGLRQDESGCDNARCGVRHEFCYAGHLTPQMQVMDHVCQWQRLDSQ
jgi:hypothetical protein